MRAINTDVAALLRAARAAGTPALEALPPAQTRIAYAANRRASQPAFDPVDEVRDLHIAGVAGPIALRIFRGEPAGQILPCLLYLHGGGWVVGDLDSHEGICRRLAGDAHCHAPEIGIDAARIAVGGDSAGGNLAAVMALMGRDGTVPRSMFQVLLYPAVDLRMTGTSYGTVAAGMPVTAASMKYFIDHYVPVDADRDDWRASPLRVATLEGAPPALVLTCGHDPLCSEGLLYAERLEREGIAVQALHLSDQAHGILNLGKLIGATAGVLAFVAAALGDAWRQHRPTA